MLSVLRSNTERFRALADGLTQEQWERAPAPGKWSPAEVAEHLVLSEQAMPRLARLALEEPEVGQDPVQVAERDTEIVESMRDDTRPQTTTAALTPKRQHASGPDAARAFLDARARTEAYVQQTTDPLRSHQFPHPAYGPLDGYQWLLMAAHHAERHVRQIERAAGVRARGREGVTA